MHRNIFCSERRMSSGLGCESKWKNMKISAASENEGWRAKKYEPTLGHIDRSKRDSSHWRSFQLWSIVIFHFLVCRTLGKHKSTIPILVVFILSQFRHLVLVGGGGPISFQHCHKQTPEISLMKLINWMSVTKTSHWRKRSSSFNGNTQPFLFPPLNQTLCSHSLDPR